MPLDRPNERIGRKRYPAKRGMGMNEPAATRRDEEMELGRPGACEQHIAGFDRPGGGAKSAKCSLRKPPPDLRVA